MGGIWKPAPVLTGLFVATMFAGIGLPGFSGFIGEFLSLVGAFIYDRPYAIVATIGVIFAAVYMLWSFQRAFTGRTRSNVAKMKDVNFRELVVVVPLIGLSLFLGIYPKPVLERIEPAAQHAIENFERKTDYRSPEHEKELVHRQNKVEKGADEERDHPERAAEKAEELEHENAGGGK
jgi:NADH-quinone oxidoreductase subunit M